MWGVRGGIAVGLWPMPGPRGLMRIYAPYLNQPPGRVFNFIAIEPVVGGRRELSELQISSSDHKAGKPMWAANDVDLTNPPVYTSIPAAGVVSVDGKAEVLRVYILVERFDNGAEPIVQVTLRSDRPDEVQLRTFSAARGAAMSECVLTATMGNWARLRHLQLKDRTVEAADVFRGQRVNDWGFYPWTQWPATASLNERDGKLTVSATGDLDASPEPSAVPLGWRYVGLPAVQSWSTAAREGVVARVNGRATFWATHAAIPSGAAFENFELLAPYRSGDGFTYSVTPLSRP